MNIIRRSAATALVAGVVGMGLAAQVAPAMATTHATHHVATSTVVKKKAVTKKNVTKKPVTKKPVTKKPVPKKPVPKKPVPKKPVPVKPVPVKLTEVQAEALAQQILTDHFDKGNVVVTGTTPGTHKVWMTTTNTDASQSANVGVAWTTEHATDDPTPYDTCDTVPEIGCEHHAFGTGTVYGMGNGYGSEFHYVRADKTVISFSEYNQDEMADFRPVLNGDIDAVLSDPRWDKVVTSLGTARS